MISESPTASALKEPRKRHFSADAIAAAKSRIIALGIDFGQWADQHGYPRSMVYEVINGNRTCRRGKSHDIAVALGLKGEPGKVAGRMHDVRP